jgi:hypothetical protein
VTNIFGKSEMEKPWRLRHQWKVNIKINLKKERFEDVDWIHLVPDENHWWVFVNKVRDHQVS